MLRPSLEPGNANEIDSASNSMSKDLEPIGGRVTRWRFSCASATSGGVSEPLPYHRCVGSMGRTPRWSTSSEDEERGVFMGKRSVMSDFCLSRIRLGTYLRGKHQNSSRNAHRHPCFDGGFPRYGRQAVAPRQSLRRLIANARRFHASRCVQR